MTNKKSLSREDEIWKHRAEVCKNTNIMSGSYGERISVYDRYHHHVGVSSINNEVIVVIYCLCASLTTAHTCLVLSEDSEEDSLHTHWEGGRHKHTVPSLTHSLFMLSACKNIVLASFVFPKILESSIWLPPGIVGDCNRRGQTYHLLCGSKFNRKCLQTSLAMSSSQYCCCCCE